VNSISSRRLRWLALPLAGSLAMAACGSKTDSSTSGSGSSGSESLSGSIFITGSSTVEPISTLVGEMFAEKYSLTPDIEGPGTGDGFKKFCAGDADVADASRAIKDEEKAACTSAGVTFTELKIGLDGITVLTSDKTKGVTCLTLEDLYALVGPESESVKKWSDASTKGATTSPLPDAELKIFAPGTESGTYDSFWELAVKKEAETKLGKDAAAKQKLRPDFGGLANDNEIVDSISTTANSFGWVGFAFAEKAKGVKEIAINGGTGCVEPTAKTVADGTYPLSRSLYIYVNNQKLAKSAALKKFVDFYLSDEGIKQVADAGYVSLSDTALAETRSAWTAAAK
jgi:phosphate transport system substrate-binding protein